MTNETFSRYTSRDVKVENSHEWRLYNSVYLLYKSQMFYPGAQRVTAGAKVDLGANDCLVTVFILPVLRKAETFTQLVNKVTAAHAWPLIGLSKIYSQEEKKEDMHKLADGCQYLDCIKNFSCMQHQT